MAKELENDAAGDILAVDVASSHAEDVVWRFHLLFDRSCISNMLTKMILVASRESINLQRHVGLMYRLYAPEGLSSKQNISLL